MPISFCVLDLSFLIITILMLVPLFILLWLEMSKYIHSLNINNKKMNLQERLDQMKENMEVVTIKKIEDLKNRERFCYRVKVMVLNSSLFYIYILMFLNNMLTILEQLYFWPFNVYIFIRLTSILFFIINIQLIYIYILKQASKSVMNQTKKYIF